MENNKQYIIELAKSITKKTLSSEYDDRKTQDILRDKLKEVCGGSTKIDMKVLRKYGADIYEIIEEIVPTIVVEGLKGNEFFMNLVDYRNKALGDDIDFYAEDNSTFIASKIARGTTSLWRQRLVAGEKVSVPTALYGIKTFEHLSRFIAGLVDWNYFIDKTSKGMLAKYFDVIYAAFAGINATTAGMRSDLVLTSTPDKDALTQLIEKVEAQTGMPVTIFGTQTALSKMPSVEINATQARDDMYTMGYYGRFGATNCIKIKQSFKAGTTEFQFDNNKIYLIPSGIKPILMLDVGEGMMQLEGDGTTNADMTKEFTYMQEFGAGVLLAGAVIGLVTFD